VAPAAASAFKLRQMPSHMRSGVSVAGSSPMLDKELLKFAESRNDDADIDRTKLKKKSKVVEVAVEKCVEALFVPSEPGEVAIDFSRDERSASARLKEVEFEQFEASQDFKNAAH
jgi:hypothetical protein